MLVLVLALVFGVGIGVDGCAGAGFGVVLGVAVAVEAPLAFPRDVSRCRPTRTAGIIASYGGGVRG